jgi:CTP:molybdopterin cytidylyltransferase MocA
VTGGLVLAAGGGTRFGSEPKLLADVEGRPVLQHTIEAMTQASELERVVVVLGAHAEQLLARVDFGRAEHFICDRWREGQSASLRCGVVALDDVAKIVVVLGDQPLLMPEVVERFAHAPPGARASYDGDPGHPAVLGPEHVESIHRLTGDRGAREILDGPLIESSDLGVPRDLDTQRDLAAIRREAAARRAAMDELSDAEITGPR